MNDNGFMITLEEYYKLPESEWTKKIYAELAKTDPIFEDCARLILLHPRLMTSYSYIMRSLRKEKNITIGYRRVYPLYWELVATGLIRPKESTNTSVAVSTFKDEAELEARLSEIRVKN